MSFSFNFSSDDIDSDPSSNGPPQTPLQNLSITDSTRTSTLTQTQTQTLNPQKWSLTQLLDSLPSQISYNTLSIPQLKSEVNALHHDDNTNANTNNDNDTSTNYDTNNNVHIPRRATHDILTHLKAEADPVFNTHETLISGLEEGDLSSGEYEGGFKTWECAGDLASYISSLAGDSGCLDMRRGCWRVIELGAGSGVPSLAVLKGVLGVDRQREGEGRDEGVGEGSGGSSASGVAGTKTSFEGHGTGKSRVRFTLCDYNEDVLRLCTAVNVMLSTILSLKDESEQRAGDQEIDLEEALPHGAASVERDLRERGVTVDFISGPWGEGLMDLLQNSEEDEKDGEVGKGAWNILVLASETIYSPSSLGVFTDTVLKLLEIGRSKGGEMRTAKALIAAKKIYFGVGGGTEEFERCVRERGGRVREVWKTDGSGVGRVILEVTMNV